MQLNEYQNKARATAIYPKTAIVLYPTLKLAGEAGEVSEKIGKIIRDKKGRMDKADKEDLKKEIGDVLWYVANLAADLDFTLEEVAIANIDKLADRQVRGKLQGSGDNR